MNIRHNKLVLEIGSGDNPKPRSDVLCDKLPEDDAERGGKIMLDRPFVASDGQYLPFADKSFDYIICCHVLEHAENPNTFLSELMRVGKAGYIETPTEIGEKLYGWPYHKWLVNLDKSGRLILKRKTEESQFGRLFHFLYSTDPIYARFHEQNHNLFHIQYEWLGKIDYEIVDSETITEDLNDQKTLERLAAIKAKSAFFSFVKCFLVPYRFRRWAKTVIAKGRRRNKKTLQDIKNIIVCPSCKGHLTWSDSIIYCHKCGREYPIRNGIPFLIVT